MCVYGRELGTKRVCVCMGERVGVWGERERVGVCVCVCMCMVERKRERVGVCVCVWARERERDEIYGTKHPSFVSLVVTGIYDYDYFVV